MNRLRSLTRRAKDLRLVGVYYGVLALGTIVLAFLATHGAWHGDLQFLLIGLAAACTWAAVIYTLVGFWWSARARDVAWEMDAAEVLRASDLVGPVSPAMELESIRVQSCRVRNEVEIELVLTDARAVRHRFPVGGGLRMHFGTGTESFDEWASQEPPPPLDPERAG